MYIINKVEKSVPEYPKNGLTKIKHDVIKIIKSCIKLLELRSRNNKIGGGMYGKKE